MDVMDLWMNGLIWVDFNKLVDEFRLIFGWIWNDVYQHGCDGLVSGLVDEWIIRWIWTDVWMDIRAH